MNVLRRFLVLLLLLPALASAGPASHAFGMAALAATGDDMCLSAAPVGEDDPLGEDISEDDGATLLPGVDCCAACVRSGGAPPDHGKEAFIRRVFFPASPPSETVTATGRGEALRYALWIRGPPAVADAA